MIELLLLAGDIKEKDTEVDELQLRLRETKRKCMWTHTNVTCYVAVYQC